MKFLVDKMPTNVHECLLSDFIYSPTNDFRGGEPHIWICRISDNLCPLYEQHKCLYLEEKNENAIE